jgi:hypothetical protein
MGCLAASIIATQRRLSVKWILNIHLSNDESCGDDCLRSAANTINGKLRRPGDNLLDDLNDK